MQLLKIITTVTVQFCAVALCLPMWVSAQNVSRIAGTNGTQGSSGDNAAATAATLSAPLAVLARADGSVLIADFGNNRVRKVDVGGIITAFAGDGTLGFSGDGGQASSAQLDMPSSLAVDAAGNVFIGARGAIRKVNPSGVISTVAGNGTPDNLGDGGQATVARVGSVWGIRVDTANNIYFTDNTYGVVRKIDGATGVITRIAGTGSTVTAFAADNVAALTAPLGTLSGIMIQADGSLLVAANGHNRVRKIIPGGNITTVAGTGVGQSTGDSGAATLAAVNQPWGLESDGEDGFYVAEVDGNRVRKVAANGTISTVIGAGTQFGGLPSTAANSGDGGSALVAEIHAPAGLSRGSNNHLHIVSYFGHTIRKIAYPPLVVAPTVPGPSTFNAYLNTVTATLGTITPAGEQSVAFGGTVNVSVTANPRHVLRVASNCTYTQTSQPIALVPMGTGTSTYAVTVNGPCQMEATFTALIPQVNINSETAANALFMATERSQVYTPLTTVAQSTSAVNAPAKFKAWVTDIAGVSSPSASNVITFKANGVAITGCSAVPLTLRSSNVLHIREATCTTAFALPGSVVITSEFVGDTYNFPAVSRSLNHSVTAAP